MTDNDFQPTKEQLATVFEYAGLPVSAERLESEFDTYSSTLALIRKASIRGIGETVPAAAFNASWE
ncbi:hypothetical protein [Rhodococcoides kyotonense]|uniref:Uncharacterized protein n=1 Tax=Rhodococcoides kyotonense TaxID=398843 RepID=A0A239HKM1_9NOCA|nr:hypothetical protein [Rhodococcus kyotonensis]SNS81681.1 hypothetical protein SAMN05421642_105314 [Rhodococcus kyotonensis]